MIPETTNVVHRGHHPLCIRKGLNIVGGKKILVK